MKKKLLICLMSGILAGCGGTQSQIPITPQTPTPPQSPNPFDSVSFPQVSCGDQPPDDPQAYPVEFYPVYIDYSENNLQKVNQLFCRAVDWNQDVIYLGYFYSRKRAEDFKDIMIREMKSGYVGEAIVVTDTPYVEPNPTNETINHYVAKDYFINSGILTDSQAKQLEFLDSLKSDRGTDVKVAIPTYIPSGFKIERFKVQTDPPSPSYQIAYKNKSNHCFFIMGGTGGFGDAPHVSINVEVFSPIFGVITLEYLSFDQNKEQVGIRGDSFVKDGNAYNFESPRWERTETPCQGIKLQETVKILKSLRYLKSF